jgi:mycothiol synthase
VAQPVSRNRGARTGLVASHSLAVSTVPSAAPASAPIPVTDLPAGLAARPLTRADLPDVYALMAAHEERVLGERMIDLEDLEGDWQRPSFEPERDSVAVLDGEQMVAYGEVYRTRRAEVYVHPEAWGRGIGTALARWTCRLAREHGGTLVGQTVSDRDEGAVALFRRLGYEPLWTSWILALPPEVAIPASPLPAGYAIRELEPGRDEQAAYQVVEDAFNEWPDREPSGYDDWAAAVLGRPGFAPWHLLLVVHGDEVVGACHLVMSGDTGWVNQIAVAREHRGRGLAQALLATAFAAARSHGAPRAELSTDSRTGALGLYEHLGMQVASSFTHWARRP